jgi:argonaute-like protein implicated in RNA metabolism and viral defense
MTGFTRYRSNLRILHDLMCWINREFLELWRNNRIKGEAYLTTIKRISKCDSLHSNPNYLIDICKKISEINANKKIHLKFCKENNIKLKNSIIKTFIEEKPKISNLEKSISKLQEELKKKEAKLKLSQDKINEANYMKSTLIFPSVCKDIYSIFSQEPSLRKEQIFKYPSDITISVISILLEKRSK